MRDSSRVDDTIIMPKDLLDSTCKDENSFLINEDLSQTEDLADNENQNPPKRLPF